MNNPLTIQLAGVMIKLYESNKKIFNEILVVGSVHRSIMLNIYGLLVKENAITKIEMLSELEKEMLWLRCKEIIAGRLSKEHCMDLARSIHALDLITQQ